MLPLVLAALLFSASQAPAAGVPAPSPTPLREIGRVRATVPCSALNDHVRPALLAALSNLAAVDAGRKALDTAASDQVRRAKLSLRFDRIAVDKAVRAMSENLAKAHEQLDAIPASVGADGADGKAVAEAKASLEQILNEQNDEINVLHGTVETDRLGEMQHEGLSKIKSQLGTGPEAAPGPFSTNALFGNADDDEIMSYLGYAGLPGAPLDPLDTVALNPTGLIGNTVFGRMASAVAEEEAQTIAGVRDAERSMLPVWRSCSLNAKPPPSPPPAERSAPPQ